MRRKGLKGFYSLLIYDNADAHAHAYPDDDDGDSGDDDGADDDDVCVYVCVWWWLPQAVKLSHVLHTARGLVLQG